MGIGWLGMMERCATRGDQIKRYLMQGLESVGTSQGFSGVLSKGSMHGAILGFKHCPCFQPLPVGFRYGSYLLLVVYARPDG